MDLLLNLTSFPKPYCVDTGYLGILSDVFDVFHRFLSRACGTSNVSVRMFDSFLINRKLRVNFGKRG